MKVKYDENMDIQLQKYIPIMKAIVAQFGANCETVLHDVKSPDRSLVALIGDVTNRPLFAPLTNFVIEIIQNEGQAAKDRLGYITSHNGVTMKSTTMFLREDHEIIGCLCINFNLKEFEIAQHFLAGFCQPFQTESKEELHTQKQNEYFAKNIEEFAENIIDETLDAKGTALQLMDKQERLMIIRKLDSKGVFLVKGTIDLVASKLGTSKYTIYNYLDEIRR
ncbi:helix-turn-helix transcriptional regulator [Paenibacillus faecalis]|uniref:helix-turn-helix transcriptional regulator n=1 Tax=Paenibacillus faecalis TaxID=2079532 RepID=UPI00131A4BD4|nr:PAS domain-containing protein [Paenibacillus faecalis]